jgi:hypothetical protein
MDNTFLYRMPAGIAGAISRPQDLTVEPQTAGQLQPFAAYGLAGKILRVSLCQSRRRYSVGVVGIYVRPYPTASQPDKVRRLAAVKLRRRLHGVVTSR